MTNDIRILDDDPSKFIRKHPEMYLPPGSASLAEKLVVLLLYDCWALNVTSLRVERFGDWCVVASNQEWLKAGMGTEQGIDMLFRKVHAMPEAGVNSVRCEVIVAAFSLDLIVWIDGEIKNIIGSANTVAAVVKRLSDNEFGTCAVMFRPAKI